MKIAFYQDIQNSLDEGERIGAAMTNLSALLKRPVARFEVNTVTGEREPWHIVTVVGSESGAIVDYDAYCCSGAATC